MPRYASHLTPDSPRNPFPGLKALERRLDRRLPHQLGSNEGLDMPHNALATLLGEETARHARAYGDADAFGVRTRLGKHLGRAMDELIVDAGADSLIALALRACCDTGSTVVTSAGTYPTFRYFAEGQGLVVHEVAYRDRPGVLAPDLIALDQAVRETGAVMVYLANPDNPSGAVYTQEEINTFAQGLPEHCWLLLDEAYYEFGAEVIDSRPLPNALRLRTFSKAHGLAGLRIGYAIASPEVIQALHTVRIHYAVSSVALAAAETVLDHDTEVQQHVQDVIDRRTRLATRLADAGADVMTSHTNFVALRLPNSDMAENIQRDLLDGGVVVHRPPHPALGHVLRISAVEDALMPGRLAPLMERLAAYA
ncbi:aminotransferase class I/II-fold pyridoxal phosphate-dependent enzyme [Larsenimonas rhizosphaerae]|uniref:histidinol-phosphate transaminase n=1 Tax=Larsenimonas rhizosphaerae TaxID=2944682 RepID=A0AA41ZGM1_9GAMM|nr:aminotransferase class I/II-fold pyridoxal phosphate-dependent enzyme [Larsenimonas rhizosphaerae]MCX2524397.1 aminotransferase class I/II-fold pyridoxal phosphate-dependent enzyme [Larsenimonas rhizosphaerae]